MFLYSVCDTNKCATYLFWAALCGVFRINEAEMKYVQIAGPALTSTRF